MLDSSSGGSRVTPLNYFLAASAFASFSFCLSLGVFALGRSALASDAGAVAGVAAFYGSSFLAGACANADATARDSADATTTAFTVFIVVPFDEQIILQLYMDVKLLQGRPEHPCVFGKSILAFCHEVAVAMIHCTFSQMVCFHNASLHNINITQQTLCHFTCI